MPSISFAKLKSVTLGSVLNTKQFKKKCKSPFPQHTQFFIKFVIFLTHAVGYYQIVPLKMVTHFQQKNQENPSHKFCENYVTELFKICYDLLTQIWFQQNHKFQIIIYTKKIKLLNSFVALKIRHIWFSLKIPLILSSTLCVVQEINNMILRFVAATLYISISPLNHWK